MTIDLDDWEDGISATDHIVEHMKKQGLAITRQSYLGFCYPDGVPMESPGELDVPRWLRDEEDVVH